MTASDLRKRASEASRLEEDFSLVSLHNLSFLHRLMDAARAAIREGRFSAFMKLHAGGQSDTTPALHSGG